MSTGARLTRTASLFVISRTSSCSATSFRILRPACRQPVSGVRDRRSVAHRCVPQRHVRLSPRTVNEARFCWRRFNLFFGPRDADLETSGPQFLFSGTTISTVGLSQSFPQGRIFNNYQFQDTLTHTVGNHTLRVGTDILVQRAKQFVPINTRGTLTFAAGGNPTFGNDAFSGVGTGAAAKVFGEGTDFPNVTTCLFRQRPGRSDQPDAQPRSALRALRLLRTTRRSRRSPATLRCKRA